MDEASERKDKTICNMQGEIWIRNEAALGFFQIASAQEQQEQQQQQEQQDE